MEYDFNSVTLVSGGAGRGHLQSQVWLGPLTFSGGMVCGGIFISVMLSFEVFICGFGLCYLNTFGIIPLLHQWFVLSSYSLFGRASYGS